MLCVRVRARAVAGVFYFIVHWSRNMGASGRAMLLGPIPRSPAGSPSGIIGPGKQVIAWIGPKTSLLVAPPTTPVDIFSLQQRWLVNRQRKNRQLWPERKPPFFLGGFFFSVVVKDLERLLIFLDEGVESEPPSAPPSGSCQMRLRCARFHRPGGAGDTYFASCQSRYRLRSDQGGWRRQSD